MFLDDCEKEYKLVAPDIDELIGYLDQGLFNTVASTPAIERAIEPLIDLLKPLAPLKDVYDEVKELWIRIPRGESCDNDYDYPEEIVWYRLLLRKGFNYDGSLYYYALSLNNQSVINATIGGRVDLSPEEFEEGAAIKVCELILPAVEESMNLLKDGKYNELVQMQLPYKHRVGVIKRSEIWTVDPEKKKEAFGRLSEDDVDKFKSLIASGINHEDKIGRIKEFTANDFFMACKLGYEAVGENCEGHTLSELYRRFSDGRDEGLTGAYRVYDEDIGIDFDDPKAWDDWYFGRTHRGSGHPWEVYPGVYLYVSDDRFDVEMDYKRGDISEDEYKAKRGECGYYFDVAAVNRPFESVKFYNALSEAGYPVIVSGGRELVDSFDGADYIGIVPHMMTSRYCAEIIPEKYGEVIGFEYVEKGRDHCFDKIIWIPEDPAELLF